ncbi:hypothetical protein HK102_001588 [Quaeritorhiza haematococci]|nr:hypothetical protein HK102_001588 [Quaeritorhiza haematococci]
MPRPQQKQTPIIIAVLGVTGVGKSHFISKTAKNDKYYDQAVGHNLASQTKQVVPVHFQDEFGRDIVLLDTPGFDDTEMDEATVLNEIVSFLTMTYREGQLLAGILYLHRISDVRMPGSAVRTYRMFERLCGENSAQSVIFTTTQWDGVDDITGNQRQSELMSNFWKFFIDRGAEVRPYDGGTESGRTIIEALLDKRLGPVTLQVQDEVVNQGLEICQTAAGREVNRHIAELQERYEAKMREMRDEFAEAMKKKDQAMMALVDEERRQYRVKIQGLEKARMELFVRVTDLEKRQKRRGLWQVIGEHIDGFFNAVFG